MTAKTTDLDIFSYDNIVDSAPLWKKIRDMGDGVKSTKIDAYLVASEAGVRELLENKKDFLATNSIFGNYVLENQKQIEDAAGNPEPLELLLTQDGPKHFKKKGTVTKAFKMDRIDENFRPLAEQIVQDQLDMVEAKGSFEAMQDLAIPLTVRLILDVLGVPYKGLDVEGVPNPTWLRNATAAAVTYLGHAQNDRFESAEMEFYADQAAVLPSWIIQEAEGKRANPGQDLLTQLVRMYDTKGAKEGIDALNMEQLIEEHEDTPYEGLFEMIEERDIELYFASNQVTLEGKTEDARALLNNDDIDLDFVQDELRASLKRTINFRLMGDISLILFAGNLTTTSLIGYTLKHLADNPDVYQEVRNDRSLVPFALEESLRIDPPAGGGYRLAARDTTFRGVDIKEGEQVFYSLVGAGRDPAVYDNPNTFDIHRSCHRKTDGSVNFTSHLSFGRGAHLCIGRWLARMEGEVALNAVLDRFSSLELAPGHTYEAFDAPLFRQPKELPFVYK